MTTVATGQSGPNNNTQKMPPKNEGNTGDAVTSLGVALAGVSVGRGSTEEAGLGWNPSSGVGGFSSFSQNMPAPSSPERKKRGESIELFLARSPSQSLGGDLLKLNNQGIAPNLPEMSGFSKGSIPPGISMQPQQTIGRRDSSPTGSATGTSVSSRSQSPTQAQAQPNFQGQQTKGHISATQTFDKDANALLGPRNFSQNSLRSIDENYDSRPHRMQQQVGASQPSGLSSFSSYAGSNPSADNNNGAGGAPTAQPQMVFPLQQPLQQGNHQQQSQAQPQQVFYMAVTTQDGHQVLQPVQMVQIPGQPSAVPVIMPPGQAGTGLVGVPMNNSSAPQMMYDQQMQGSPSQPVMLMSGLPSNSTHAEVSSPSNAKMYGNRRPKGGSYPSQQHRVGTSTSVKHHDTYGYGNSNSQNFDEHQFQSKHMGSSPPPYLQGEQYPGSRRATPSSSRGPSPRSSPTPNDVISSLYAAPQRPPLEDLLGHVRRLSRDQVGCRLLQQALDEEGPRAATLILNEGLTFWGEAMVDPFGNYLFQKILEKITPEERIVLVKSVSPRLVNASLNLHGTRSVQKVVELCSADEAAATAASTGADAEPSAETAAEILTRSLTPAAARLCIDSHGNHVIQRILQKLPYQHSQFVFDAVAASVGDVARHRHGCCVIQRCLDSPPSEARSHLVGRIVDKALELMQDAYGNYVVQYVLDVCGDDEVHSVCESVVGRVNLLAIQKFSSNVMEKCLERCTDNVREQYLIELSDPDKIRELMMDPFGNYVIQRALAVATHAQAVSLVEAIKPHLLSGSGGQNSGGLRNTAGGRRIMAKISRRFPNFNLGVGDEQHLYQSQRHSGHRQNHGHHHHHNHQNQHHSNHMPQVPMTSPPPKRRGGYYNDGQQSHQYRDSNRYHDGRQGSHMDAGMGGSYQLPMGNGGMAYHQSM